MIDLKEILSGVPAKLTADSVKVDGVNLGRVTISIEGDPSKTKNTGNKIKSFFLGGGLSLFLGVTKFFTSTISFNIGDKKITVDNLNIEIM